MGCQLDVLEALTVAHLFLLGVDAHLRTRLVGELVLALVSLRR